jgi:hypothetical protein
MHGTHRHPERPRRPRRPQLGRCLLLSVAGQSQRGMYADQQYSLQFNQLPAKKQTATTSQLAVG